MKNIKVMAVLFGVGAVFFGVNMMSFLLRSMIETNKSLGVAFGREYLAIQIVWLVALSIFVILVSVAVFGILKGREGSISLSIKLAFIAMAYGIYHLWVSREYVFNFTQWFESAPDQAVHYVVQVSLIFGMATLWVFIAGRRPTGAGKELKK